MTSEYLYDETSAATDRMVLELLYEQPEITSNFRKTGDTWGNNENWMTTAPLGEWYGITTNVQGRITEIDLTSNDIDGKIPREIGNLWHLEVLNLRANDIAKKIPREIGNLPYLERLDLSSNLLRGPIPPEIGNLSNLRYLSLGGNQLSGNIPAEIGNLAKLEVLGIATNRLGTAISRHDRTGIPEELGNLPNLTVLLISPQDSMIETACIPAKLKGQLRTDLPFPEIIPFCEE